MASYFSLRRFRSLARQAPALARWHAGHARLPIFAPAAARLAVLPPARRVALQRALLDAIDHADPFQLYCGVVGASSSRALQDDTALAVDSCLRLVRDLHGRGKTFARFLDSLGPRRRAFASMLATSRFVHRRFRKLPPRWDELPLFVELAADFMVGAHGPLLAELQLLPLTRPHVLPMVHAATRALVPSLFRDHAVPVDGYAAARVALLERAARRFGADYRAVIDGWAKCEQPGQNHRPLAAELDAEYHLFDELRRRDDGYRALAKKHRRLFFYNQVPGYLLDPDRRFFGPLERERLERYPELGWPGAMADHLAGKTFFTASPLFDLLNDKALYPFLPAIAEFYCGERWTTPICPARGVWEDDAVLQWALDRQDDCVLAHRYLEEGQGIKIGRFTSPRAWRRFVEAKVRPRPELYVARGYYPMAPVHSYRLFGCGLYDGGRVTHAVSREFLGRVSWRGPIDNLAAGGDALFLAVTSERRDYDADFTRAGGQLRAHNPDGAARLPPAPAQRGPG